MTNSDQDTALENDRAVEQLLRQVPPRPMPPEVDAEQVRAAVHTEWQSVTGKRRTRRLVTTFAIAATVVLAVSAAINTLRVPSAVPIAVATIDKSIGSIYLLGQQSALQEIDDLSVLTAGQTIVTGNDAGVGLAWEAGGSLRIGENTRVEFASESAVVLTSGTIYFDSTPSELSAGITQGDVVPFEIRTEQGIVSHVGTQYMISVDASGLFISVREGQVSVARAQYKGTADEGERMEFSGHGQPAIFNISRHGKAWDWVEAVAPSVDVDKRSVDEFLRWVSHETGLQLRYENATVESAAQLDILTGTVNIPPRDALDLWSRSVGIDWQIEGGTIVVSERL